MQKRDIHKEITDKIVGILEEVNLDDFEAPFAGLAAQGLPFNPATENHYQGINIPSLWVDQQHKELTSSEWATFKQWKRKGAQVRKGEKGSPVIFYKTWTKNAENEHGESEEISIPVMRFYTVFNADQVDGYEPEVRTDKVDDAVTRIEAAEAFYAKTGAAIKHGEARAYYSRAGDFINMPETSAFVETRTASATENYYSVLLHELTHWTGAPKRLDRDKAKSRAEIEKYAFVNCPGFAGGS